MATLTTENAVLVLVVKVISVSLTGVNEELVGDSWVVDVVNCTGENGSKNFKVCENRLKGGKHMDVRSVPESNYLHHTSPLYIYINTRSYRESYSFYYDTKFTSVRFLQPKLISTQVFHDMSCLSLSVCLPLYLSI